MKKTLSLLLALAILLSNMFLASNNKATAAEAEAISKIYVTGVVEPKVGEKIQTQGIEVKAEGGSVKFKNATWAKKEGSKWNSVGEDQTTFREGEEYRITILVDPLTGSKFSNSTEAFVNGKKTEDALIFGDGLFITESYDKLPEVKPTEKAQQDMSREKVEPKAPKIVKEVKLSGVVAPKAGQAPKKDNIKVEAVGGTVELKKSNWLVKDGNNWRSMSNSENVFEADKEYRFTALVDTKEGSKFDANPTATVNNEKSNATLLFGEGVLVDKDFPKLEAAPKSPKAEEKSPMGEVEKPKMTEEVKPEVEKPMGNPGAKEEPKKTEEIKPNPGTGETVKPTEKPEMSGEAKPKDDAGKTESGKPTEGAKPKDGSKDQSISKIKFIGLAEPKIGDEIKFDGVRVEEPQDGVLLKKVNWFVKENDKWVEVKANEKSFEAGKEYAVRILVDPMNGSKFVLPVNAFVNDKEADEVLDIAGGLLIEKRYAKLEDPSAVKTHKISYDLNGGKLNGKTGIVTIEAKEGETITLPEAPEREGYKFTYWKGSKYNPGDKYVVKGQHTFTAQWEAIKAEEKPNVDPKPQAPKAKPEKPNVDPKPQAPKAKPNMENKQGQIGEQKNNNQKPQVKSQTMKAQGQNNIKNMAPKTGDQANVILSISLIGLAGAGLLLMMKKRAAR
ncbi:InlB B-repeat-containing protein [Peptoniphilaceae bacterium SGI.131]